jgi:hypothetical protein
MEKVSMSIPVFSKPMTGTTGSYKKWLNWKTRFTMLCGGKEVANALTNMNDLDEDMTNPLIPAHVDMMARVVPSRQRIERRTFRLDL